MIITCYCLEHWRKQMNISIIITYYQGINILSYCLEHLYTTTMEYYGKLEIIIANDNPTVSIDNSLTKFDGLLDYKIIPTLSNKGYAAACNYVIDYASYEYILLMDSDIIPSGNWLLELTQTYLNENLAGCVSSKIFEMDCNNLFGFGMGIYNLDILLYKRHGKESEFTKYDRNFQFVSSGCMLMKKSIYNEVGGQDEMFINSDNDLDLALKVYNKGYINMLSTNSVVYHRGGVSGDIRNKPFRQDAKALFFKKWGHVNFSEAFCILKELYRDTEINISHGTGVIIVSFSNSVSRDDYINLFIEEHHLQKLQLYDYKNISLKEHIILPDFLPWDICRTNIPILYFLDDYRQIQNNHFWFMNRPENFDIIFDRNGNVFKQKQIICT